VKYRIISNGFRFKIQTKSFLLWHTHGYLVGDPVDPSWEHYWYTTLEQAIAAVRHMQAEEKDNPKPHRWKKVWPPEVIDSSRPLGG
jgi:hypothetical protein